MYDDHDTAKFKVAEFIDTLYGDVCGDKVCLENGSMESYEICKELIDDLIDKVILEKKPPTKFQCDICERGFKDNTDLKEHKVRMHSEPTACMICNAIYPDQISTASFSIERNVSENVHLNIVHTKQGASMSEVMSRSSEDSG